jgi:hypothetical protein
MQKNVFVGNLARPATVTGTGDRAVARFTLIANEYAGKDKDTGQTRERRCDPVHCLPREGRGHRKERLEGRSTHH